jgi:CRISPR-associated protein Csm1
LNTPSFNGFKLIPNYIPSYESEKCKIREHSHEEGEPLSFECIAEFSNGEKSLGFLKGDADNMGKVFREGFKNTKLTISRYSCLSRMFETFFSGYLNYKIKEEFNEIYVIFSGGDDFFIAGPWDRVIEFSKTIRREYEKFVGFNSDLTFSAGLIFAKPHEPISFCAEAVEEALKNAKNTEGKDSIRIFEKNLKWEELEILMEEAKKVIEWLKSEPPVISRSTVFNFREYGLMAEKSKILEGKDIETRYLKFVPLMVYDIERNLKDERQKEAFEWAYSFLPNQKSPISENLKYLRVIMEYVLKYTRREK